MNKIVKGILLMLGVILTALNNPPVVWTVVIATSFLLGAGYFIKNYMSPSTSPQGTISWIDIASACLLAVIAALSDSLGSLIVNGTILWSLVGKTVLTTAITYITTTYFSGNIPAPEAK